MRLVHAFRLLAIAMVFGYAVFGQAHVGQAQSTADLARTAGCFKCHNLTDRVVGPSFKDIASRYQGDVGKFDLRLMTAASTVDLPERRKSTAVVARVGKKFHVRIFDSRGQVVVDKSEEKLIAAPLAKLKEIFSGDSVAAAAELSADARKQTLEAATAAAGFTPADIRKSLIETIKRGGKGHWPKLAKGTPMPAFSGRLSDRQIERLVDFILRPADSLVLNVMTTGLGSGRITSSPAGIDLPGAGEAAFAPGTAVTLTAVPDVGSVFKRWVVDPEVTSPTFTVTMNTGYFVRAEFERAPAAAIPPLTDLTPEGIDTYLRTNTSVTTAAQFLAALRRDFRQNWILMSRSESLQTGTAEFPRIILPSEDARNVFTLGLALHSAYPGAHPDAIEYMQWDQGELNFRFHEIVLNEIQPMHPIPQPDGSSKPTFPLRPRGVKIDDIKCSRCHSTQNVANKTKFPGTLPPGNTKAKNKPNWDTYDSWGGMMPFNRDRIFQGSVEAAAFRKILNPWTWRSNPNVRAVFEQLELQPPPTPGGQPVSPDDVIKQFKGGEFDGLIEFSFDDGAPVSSEPDPVGDDTISTNYEFNAREGTGPTTEVKRGGRSVLLRHSKDFTGEEGRGVQLFDLLSGGDGQINAERIAAELIEHKSAGGVTIDVRPLALAICNNLLEIDEASNKVKVVDTIPTQLLDQSSFFDARNGLQIVPLRKDTLDRSITVPRRKADIQKLNLARTGDAYLRDGDTTTKGLMDAYGPGTAVPPEELLKRLRQQVFRRESAGDNDLTEELDGIYVDREDHGLNEMPMALFRYFLEPLGVSVDKWSTSVRGRSRTYTFADVLGTNLNVISDGLLQSIQTDTRSTGLTNSFDLTTDAGKDELIKAVNRSISTLPPVDDIPTFVDIQRIFNRNCIECHGGLNYPPYIDFALNSGEEFIDFSEDDAEPPVAGSRLGRSHANAVAQIDGTAASLLYRLITRTNESCNYVSVRMMPCGGPALSKVDIKSILRWIVGGAPSTLGDPHIKTVDGVTYDFQAAGEFVALRGVGFEMQIRQLAVGTQAPPPADSPTELATGQSVNNALAVRIGAHRITYQPRRGNNPATDGLQLRIDGRPVDLPADGLSVARNTKIVPTIAPGGIQIEAPGGTAIVVTPGYWEHYKLWFLHVDLRHVRVTEGLMGRVAPGDWLPALPTGEMLGPKPDDLGKRYQDLYEKFGNAWRVKPENSLFDYEPGMSTATYTIADWPPRAPAASYLPPLGAGGTGLIGVPARMSLDEARNFSAEISNPVLKARSISDLAATGNRAFAEAYLLTDRIRRNAPPTPPVLVSPEDQSQGLGSELTFKWKASTDPDGAPIKYRFYLWRAGTLPDNNQATPVTAEEAQQLSKAVSGLLPGKKYNWKVIADDGKGRTAESDTYRISIK